MSPLWLLIIILVLAVVGFVAGAPARARQRRRPPQAAFPPNYYGVNVAMLAFVPALLVLGAWLVVQPIVVNSMVSADIPESALRGLGRARA
jgi:phosphate transport system permease protein